MAEKTITTERNVKKTVVIGGGASGQRTAADLLQAGLEVILIEAEDTIGGTVTRLGTMFPKHNCLLCRGDEQHGEGCTRPGISSLFQDYTKPSALDIRTRSRVVEAERDKTGEYALTVLTEPRFVFPEKCILCGKCSDVCPQSLPDPYQGGFSKRKAVYLPAERCIPESYAVEMGSYCEHCHKCEEICPTGAIDLSLANEIETITADAVVLATGMRLYNPIFSSEYGYGRFPNVISGLEMERLISPAGPGEGNPVRPSDGEAPARIAWLQCIGSRDENHDYCSSFCCGYATKQAVAAKKLLPSAEMRIFMMDDRVFGRNFSQTYDPLRRQYDVELEHCRISVLRQDNETKNLILQITGEDGRVREEEYGMVILSIGAEGTWEQDELQKLFSLDPDKYGFIRTNTLSPLDTGRPGVFTAGTVSGPSDIADSVTGGSAAAARVCSYLGIKMAAEETEDSSPRVVPEVQGLGPRVGIFACDCAGEIGGTADLRAVKGRLQKQGAGTLEIIPYGCMPEGLDTIRNSIRKNNYTCAVIGACKRRTYASLFEKELSVPVEFASLREECAYVHHDDPKGATEKAVRILYGKIRISAARGDNNSNRPVRIESPREVLVIGGGLAGITASLHVADFGVPVRLVEREEVLGGNALKLDRTPEGENIQAFLDELISEVKNHPLITLHTGSEIVRQVSSKGVLTASLRTRRGQVSEETVIKAGAEIIATGGEEYRGTAFLLGSSERVITLLDLGMKLRNDPTLLKELKQVVFIGCVGPWSENPDRYSWRCSRNCCETMVKRARALKEINPRCNVTVLVREVNTYAFKEEEYTAARKAGVLFVRYVPDKQPAVFNKGERLLVEVWDKNLGEILEFHPDLIVLASAILPRRDAGALSASINVELDNDGFFKEWESKTRPYSSLEPGISISGLAHGPKPLKEVISQALAASQNVLGNIRQTRSVDVREVAAVSFGDCTSCLTCVRTCPYSVPRIGEEEYPQNRKQGRAFIDIFRCQGCGACVSECPAGAITLEKYNDRVLIESGVLGGSVNFRGKPRSAGDDTEIDYASDLVTIISCKYCGNVPIELAGTARYQYPSAVQVIEVPCTGFVKVRHILTALEQGAKGVLIHACPEGTCHHLTGNTRAEKRLSYVKGLVEAAGISPERVRFANFGIGHGKAFAELAGEFISELQNVKVPEYV